MKRLILIASLVLMAACTTVGPTTDSTEVVGPEKARAAALAAKARERYCAQPYTVRLAAHQAAMTAIAAASKNPIPATVPYIDPCLETDP